MVTSEFVSEELKSIKKLFSCVIQEDSFFVKDSIISWKNYSPGISKFLYSKEFRDNINKRQYSFLLNDNSHFQFFYEFENGILIKAKLAYFPVPVPSKEDNDISKLEEYLDEEDDFVLSEYYYDLFCYLSNKFNNSSEELNQKIQNLSDVGQQLGLSREEVYESWIEKKYKLVNTSHFRIDYDSKVDTHHKIEIQFGGVNYIRFPFDKLISPFLFFEFIIKHVFSDEFNELSIKKPYILYRGHTIKNSMPINPFEENNIYITHK
jgi:hypothetical protein